MTFRSALFASALSLIVTACAAGPDYDPPATPEPDRFSRTLEREADAPSGPRWWTGFEDPTLAAVVEAALEANLDIAQSAQRLAAAQALLGAAQSDFLPTLDGGAAYGLRSSGADNAGASLSISQVVDINGRLRRAEERAEAQRLAARFSLEDIRRLTAASAAQRYVDLRRAQTRLALLDTSLELQQRTLDIVEQRAQAGLSADLDVRRATSDLARTRAQRGALELQLARSNNALAVLLAEVPGRALALLADDRREGPLALGLGYQAGLPVGVPADMLRRRPDVRASEARLIAATAEIGISQASLYPSLRLPGSISADFDEDLSTDIAASLSAVLDIPLFDFGRRQAEVTAAEARALEAALAYQQSVLRALEEVEGGLVAIESVEARLADLQIAVDQGEQAYDQLNALYREGLASFIDVLDAQRTLIGNREALVDTEAELARAIIDLNLALATSTQAG
jgi:NodT family efflux transporter outer membrane factor (OMF) lipoprotein